MNQQLLSRFVILLSCFFTVVMHAKKPAPLEKEIVITSQSRNNKTCYEKNLASMLNQHYTNYRIIWVDDASIDGTPELVEAYLKQHDTYGRVTFIKNKERQGALKNFYTSTHTCNDDAIIVFVDGDDVLAHNSVLEIVNQHYQNPDVWITYGSLKPLRVDRWNPAYWTKVPDDIIATNNFRHYRWVTSHLRTYYAWLFKLIKKEDLLYKGNFYEVAHDAATMFPMLEMAGFHSKFVEDYLLIYNDESPINDAQLHTNLIAESYRNISNAKKYAPLTERPAKTTITVVQ